MLKQLHDMALFALVVEQGSFTAAARHSGLPKSAVSQRIRQLEERIGLRLLNRTTRHLSMTEAGERYWVYCKELLSTAEQAENVIQSLREAPNGRLRITAAAGVTVALLSQLVSEFRPRYPNIALEIYTSDTVLDLVHEGFDIALRAGKPKDSSLIARYLGKSARYLVAAPTYLERHPPILHPSQLNEHQIITHRAWAEWQLVSGEESYRWSQPRQHTTDNLIYARECALQGQGITLLSDFLCESALQKKELVIVLPEWQGEGNDLYLVYPSKVLNAPALECFIQHVLQHPFFVRRRLQHNQRGTST